MEVRIGRGQGLKWGRGRELMLFVPRVISAFWNVCKINVRKCSNVECRDIQLSITRSVAVRHLTWKSQEGTLGHWNFVSPQPAEKMRLKVKYRVRQK